ncbi:MAG: hypothetical protein IKC64_00060 [Clostridia bacterium]|nr:hypothetical protein [Clostridia bacterium]
MILTDSVMRRLTIEKCATALKNQILSAKDELVVTGKTYFVCCDGHDDNDGLTPDSAWKSLEKVSSATLNSGDGVLFRRGDIFRGVVTCRSGVSYGAFGCGNKPKIYGYKSLCDTSLWELYDKERNIYRLTEKIWDCGALVFNEGEAWTRKLIPSCIGGKFVLRDEPSKDFILAEQMTCNLDLFWDYSEIKPNHEVPVVDERAFGTLYLRCDDGNPATVFSSIEPLVKRHGFVAWNCNDVTIDNICVKYIGAHGVGAGGDCVKNLTVRNCEFGWIGGTIQNYQGDDPNCPATKKGMVTRYGNAVEIYGGCENFIVENNYVYQVYDAGLTHQVNTDGKTLYANGVVYKNNLVEYCTYSIEYFWNLTGGDTTSKMNDIVIENNFLRFCGYGWGNQRYNPHTPAHIKSWDHDNNARGVIIKNNIFDRSTPRLIHACARTRASIPTLIGNTYIQDENIALGKVGLSSESGEIPFTQAEIIAIDKTAKIILI